MNKIEKDRWCNELYKVHSPRLLRYVQRWVTESQAREVVQDIFLKLWQQVPEELGPKPQLWLFCCCRNRAIDILRKEGRMKPLNEDDHDIEDPADDPETQMSKNQNKTYVNQLMQKLTFNQKEVLRLKFQEGLSYNEISEVTGHSVSYVGVLIHEAMQKLKSEVSHLSMKGVRHE